LPLLPVPIQVCWAGSRGNTLNSRETELENRLNIEQAIDIGEESNKCFKFVKAVWLAAGCVFWRQIHHGRLPFLGL